MLLGTKQQPTQQANLFFWICPGLQWKLFITVVWSAPVISSAISEMLLARKSAQRGSAETARANAQPVWESGRVLSILRLRTLGSVNTRCHRVRSRRSFCIIFAHALGLVARETIQVSRPARLLLFVGLTVANGIKKVKGWKLCLVAVVVIELN